MLRKLILAVVAVPVVLAVAVHVGVDTPVQPQVWTPPKSPDTKSGPYAPNDVLAVAKRFGYDNLKQPESSAVGPDGRVYTGLNNGQVVRFSPKLLAEAGQPGRTSVELVANTGGRPLGMVFHPDGSLIVADGLKGLLKVALPEQGPPEITVLSTQSDGIPFLFVDDVAVSPDGRHAYFSDASSKFGLKEFVLDVLEHAGNGRLLEFDFETGKTRTVLGGLQFANGVAVSPAGDYVLVNETGSYRVLRHWLRGPKAGKHDVLIDNLPGFPDNIRVDAQGQYWIAFPSLRDGLIDSLADSPGVRKAIGRLLEVIEFPVKPYAMAIAVNTKGDVVANLQASKANGYYYITQVTPVGKDLFFGSVTVPGIAVLPNPLSK